MGSTRPSPKPHVGEIRLVEVDAKDQMVPDRSVAARHAHNAARHARDFEADIIERPTRVGRSSHSTTRRAAGDELVKTRSWIARQRTGELNIEILVRDVFDVTAMQAAQRVEVRPRFAFEADAIRDRNRRFTDWLRLRCA